MTNATHAEQTLAAAQDATETTLLYPALYPALYREAAADRLAMLAGEDEVNNATDD